MTAVHCRSSTEPETWTRTNKPLGTSQAPFSTVEFCLVLLAVFFSPFQYLRHPSFYLTLGDVFMAAALIFMIINKNLPRLPLGRASSFLFLGNGLLVGSMMLSSLINGDAARGMIVSLQYLFALLVVPLVVLARNQRQLGILVKAYILSIGVICLHGIYVVKIEGQIATLYVSGTGRLESLIGQSNQSGAIFAMAIMLLIWLVESGRLRIVYGLASAALLLYAILLTGSNGALIITFFSCGIYFISKLTFARMLLFGPIAIVALAFFAIQGVEFMPEAFKKRVLPAFQSGNISEAGTFSDRYNLIVEALGRAGDSLLIGIGADQYKELSAFGEAVHNAYLLIWSEGGFPALVGLGLVLLAFCLPSLSASRSPGSRAHGIIGFSVLTGFVLAAAVTTHVYARFWLVPLSLSVLIALVGGSKSRDRIKGAGGRPDRKPPSDKVGHPHFYCGRLTEPS